MRSPILLDTFRDRVTHHLINQYNSLTDIASSLLRSACLNIHAEYPFTIDTIVILPDYIHCIESLQSNVSDDATHWRLIKCDVIRKGLFLLWLQANWSTPRQHLGDALRYR